MFSLHLSNKSKTSQRSSGFTRVSFFLQLPADCVKVHDSDSTFFVRNYHILLWKKNFNSLQVKTLTLNIYIPWIPNLIKISLQQLKPKSPVRFEYLLRISSTDPRGKGQPGLCIRNSSLKSSHRNYAFQPLKKFQFKLLTCLTSLIIFCLI